MGERGDAKSAPQERRPHDGLEVFQRLQGQLENRRKIRVENGETRMKMQKVPQRIGTKKEHVPYEVARLVVPPDEKLLFLDATFEGEIPGFEDFFERASPKSAAVLEQHSQQKNRVDGVVEIAQRRDGEGDAAK